MKMNVPHDKLYPETLTQATQVQKQMAQHVIETNQLGQVNYIAGVDVSNELHDPEQRIYAAVVLLSYPELKLVETATASMKSPFPYVPGYLAFREAPALIEAFKKLQQPPDLILVDGHGISHPRHLGIASHLGVLLDLPTIGVAKSILVGQPESALPSNMPGAMTPLIWHNQEIAMVFQSKKRCNPIYVSIGNKVDLPTAIQWTQNCLKGYRLPEPTRLAHQAANTYRKNAKIMV